MITYTDGNGNTYIISDAEEKFLEYKPVKPYISFSGVYDGGDYKKIKISRLDYENIIIIINIAIANESVHLKNRVKGSGLIIIKENGAKYTYIIDTGCEEQIKIEKLLKEIILQ